jgi:hypothetical protein
MSQSPNNIVGDWDMRLLFLPPAETYDRGCFFAEGFRDYVFGIFLV